MGQNERPCKNVVRLFASAPFLHILGSTFFFFLVQCCSPAGRFPTPDRGKNEERVDGCVWEGGKGFESRIAELS